MGERFDYFIALDGFGLNGFEGFGGIARLRCNPAADQYDIKVKFYDGLAGGHATQINSQGTIGYLGNLSQTLFFYDPRTLKELKRFSTLRFYAPDVFYSSQTHVAWIDETHFITVLGPDLYLFDYHDLENPKRLGAHGVTLPHAMKKSKSGRYLFIGAMDHDKKGYANQLGIFDLETNEAKVVALPATAWHLGVHPTKDVCYAPTQRCTPQENMEFVEYTMAHFKNYLYEIDAESAQVTRHLTIPKDLPGFLTSDVVVTETEVLYNCCASHVIAIADLETFSKVEYIDEIPSFFQQIWYWKAGLSNLLEAISRVNLPGAVHTLFKSLRITRWTSIDGSFGLQLSPDKRYLISARRGMNMVVVYTYPGRKLVKRIPFPSIRKFFPEHVGWFGDPRLGFHHTELCTTSVEENG